MQYVTIDQLNEYTNNYEDSTLKSAYIEAAEQVVKDYLGFDPEVKEYDEYFSGIGDTSLYLHAQPVIQLNELEIDGVVQDVAQYTMKGQAIYSNRKAILFPIGIDNIRVSYVAGYEDIPGIVKLTVLRIASLLLQEAGGNIGLTGKSFSDNSRTFINYSDYKKYLKPLDGLRIIRM